MAKTDRDNKGFQYFRKDSTSASSNKQKQVYVHHFKKDSEDLRDAEIADAAYENYLQDPSGARPLDELMAEWEAMDAKQEKAKR